MHSRLPPRPNTEELSPGHYRRMGIYAPFVWATVWVIILGQRMGVISPEFLKPSRPDIAPYLYHRNRQLRRARRSCLRRVHRHLLKGRKIHPENYTPRAYAHFAYVNMMDKTMSAGQFTESYIRDSDVSRVEFCGLDGAHHISGYVLGICQALASFMTSLSKAVGLSSSSFAGPSDPAPP